MLKLTNLAEWHNGWKRWLAEQEEGALAIFRGLASTTYAYVVEETPEYTGETVANWTFHVDGPLLKYASGIKLSRKIRRQGGSASPIWQKPGTHMLPTIQEGNGGNPAALRLARNALREGFREVASLGQTIWIANATHFDPSGFAVGALENPPGGWLRQVNTPGMMMQRAVSYVSDVFRKIDATNMRRLMVMPA